MMLKICEFTIDKKGRIQLPKSFMDANGIRHGDRITMTSILNSTSCKLQFDCAIDAT